MLGGNIVFFEGFDSKRRRNINDTKMDSVLLEIKSISFLSFCLFIPLYLSCRVPRCLMLTLSSLFGLLQSVFHVHP
jgi:hypothetical protein